LTFDRTAGQALHSPKTLIKVTESARQRTFRPLEEQMPQVSNQEDAKAPDERPAQPSKAPAQRSGSGRCHQHGEIARGGVKDAGVFRQQERLFEAIVEDERTQAERSSLDPRPALGSLTSSARLRAFVSRPTPLENPSHACVGKRMPGSAAASIGGRSGGWVPTFIAAISRPVTRLL
jgi:hypothetical protein